MKAKTYTIGLDLGDRRHHVCVLDKAGEILAEEAIVNAREVLSTFSARYPGATVEDTEREAVEAPMFASLLARLCEPSFETARRRRLALP